MRRIVILIALMAALVSPKVSAAARVDSTLTVSLLTCSPGEETYELYGHTAILVRARNDSLRVVYNYGVFSFDQPHFIWRFVLGQTDYMVMPCPLSIFLKSYTDRGSWVEEQRLNLTVAEANLLADSLAWYSRRENCVYRYDIFRSNCTTKARDIIEHCIRGRVIYPVRPRRNTFRTILHECTGSRKGGVYAPASIHPWADAGNDFLLGADVDTLITERDEMFAPLYMMNYADSAMILSGYDAYRPLVSTRVTLLEANDQRRQKVIDAQPAIPVKPGHIAWAGLVFCLLVAAYEWRCRRVIWQTEAIILTLQGIIGLLLTFMALFSEHPGVASNWLVVPFNPLPLLFLVPVVISERRQRLHPYHYFAAVVLVFFVIAFYVVPQDFPALILPLALSLLSRSISNIAIFKRWT